MKASQDFCPRCYIGRLRGSQTTYLQRYGTSFISVPETPVCVCDVCGYREFEAIAVDWLDDLTSPLAEMVDDVRPRHGKTATDPAEPRRLKP